MVKRISAVENIESRPFKIPQAITTDTILPPLYADLKWRMMCAHRIRFQCKTDVMRHLWDTRFVYKDEIKDGKTKVILVHVTTIES